MKSYPRTPTIDGELWRDPQRVQRVFALLSDTSDASYLHWEELRHRTPPRGVKDVLEWWLALKLKRTASARIYPELKGYGDCPLSVSSTATMDAQLARFDRLLAGEIAHQGAPVDAQTRDRYVSSSLMEEAIHSSLFEGAVSTREIAKDMLREGRSPLNKDERMIVNNHKAMLRLQELAQAPLTVDGVLQLHSILVDQTLEEPAQAGRIQLPGEERVVVWDKRLNRAVHTPPPAEELPDRLRRLVAFANGDDVEGDRYTHPVIRSILLHFQLAFDHPFADGNGRTARALFYWSMLRRGFWLAEFVSISRLIHQRPEPYRRAFLFVESDPQDATYFVRHQLDTLDRAVDELHAYMDRKRHDIDEMRALVRRRGEFNTRQLALLDHALRHADAMYTHESHANSHRISIVAARSDLQALVSARLLTQERHGKKFVYRPALRLESRLKR